MHAEKTGNPATATNRVYDAYFFDLDGTIYLGDRLLPGVVELFDWLVAQDLPYAFVTNNPSKTVTTYETRLESLGLPARGRVITSGTATVKWLQTHRKGAVVYPISEPPLIETLTEGGIEISDDPNKIDIVIASFDRTFDYAKLDIAFRAIVEEKRAILVATNPDRYCPMEHRLGVPDAGAIIGAIEGCTNVKCSYVFGKPAPALVEIAAEILGVSVARSVMIGDRLYTDIAMAINAGMDGALVLTGDSTMAEVMESDVADRPLLCLENIGQLIAKP
ncbi:MAG: HAD-IIA family hydrolase [Rhodobacterales bacterium]|nr:HAD-IIA family hydrolase [Rhodobacterales bacterium]